MVATICVLVLLAVGGVIEGPKLLHHSHGTTSASPSTTAAPASKTTTSTSAPVTTTTTVATTTTTARRSTPKPTGPTAKAVASTFSSLLTQSEADRGRVLTAAGLLSSCTNLSGAETAFDASIQERQHLESTIGAMNVTALPGGAAVKNDFLSFLRASAADDQVLASWTAEKMSGGCSEPAPSDTAQLNDAATAAKETFVGAWAPIAQKYSLPSVSNSEI